MSPNRTRHASALRRQGGEAGLERGRQAVGIGRVERQDERKVSQRPLDLGSAVADDDEAGPEGGGQSGLRDVPHEGLAPEERQHFRLAAEPRALPGGEHDGGDAAHLVLARAAGPRLGPRDDLHQEAADAERHDVVPRDRHIGEEPLQDPVEAVLLRRARAARRADDRFAAERTDEEQVARIDRHAEMLDAAAGRFDGGRDHVAPVGDRRGAEDDDQFGLAGRLIGDRPRQRSGLVRHPRLCRDTGAPAGESRVPRTCTVLSTTLGFKPGIRVETTPTCRRT